MVIFLDSQSDTTEGFANRLMRDCRSRLSLDTLAADLSEYDSESISNIPETKVAIFILSTYEEGDPSDNTAQLFSWVNTNELIKFPNLRYAAFGLSNSKFKFYNRVVDVTGALNRLEAKALISTGKTDNSEGSTEENFTEWKQSLFSMLYAQLNCEKQATEYEPSLNVVENRSLDLIDLYGEPAKPREGKKVIASSSATHPLVIRKVRKLFSKADLNYLHIELDISEHLQLKYKTGDHLAIWPSNLISEVDRLFECSVFKIARISHFWFRARIQASTGSCLRQHLLRSCSSTTLRSAPQFLEKLFSQLRNLCHLQKRKHVSQNWEGTKTLSATTVPLIT